MKTRDPKTPAEWQAAVDTAEACLLIDSARQYGLITGGPVVDVDRCEQILIRGRARGFTPIQTGVDAQIQVLVSATLPRETPDTVGPVGVSDPVVP
jgi:hypothetical protein